MAYTPRTALTFAALFAAHATEAQAPKPATGFGMAGAPTEVIAAAHDGSWVAMCHARHDTDHSGALSISIGFNITSGDAQRAYVGSATRTATVVGRDVEGHVMAIADDGRLLVGFGGANGHWGFEPGPLEWLAATPVRAALAPTP